MANTRLALGVEIAPGDQHTGKHVAVGLWSLLDRLPREHWPVFIRGDVSFGSEAIMAAAEQRQIHYLTKLRLTSHVKRLIYRLIARGQWVDAGQGFQGCEGSLCLTGWTKTRRVIVLKRPIKGEILLEDPQQSLAFVEADNGVSKYEYQVLVTSLDAQLLTIAQHYRDRGDCENCFDELKNQWGWGGFTTHDLHRCRIISRLVALVYNWWSLFARLINPDQHHEAITSRPLMLEAIGRKTEHAGQTTITVTSTHAKASIAHRAMLELARYFKELARTAEQLAVGDRLRLIARRAYRKLLPYLPLLPAPDLIPVPG
jgi:hypothetical protein